jgi:hypothetical protein
MADQVLIVREPGTSRVKFDSRLATGGVCLGIYTVPSGQHAYSFPGMGPGLAGLVLTISGNNLSGLAYTYDNALGYPRFTFNGVSTGEPVALFVK